MEYKRKLQLIKFDMIKDIDKIYKINNIKYNLSFDLLLRAVRHMDLNGGDNIWKKAK